MIKMNFHGLTRSDLQFLCKMNHILANTTNVVMANTLSSLQIVEGLDEFMNLSDATPTRKKRSTPVVTRSMTHECQVVMFTETPSDSQRTESASVELKEIKEVEDEENEESSSTQAEQIRRLQCQLNSANEKLKMAEIEDKAYAADAKVELEKNEEIIHELRDQLARGEELRKKLQNTILELKGNIRVFCRVRPPMSADSAVRVIDYPTSTEALGHDIELLQSGTTKYSFTFNKVFSHDASQESVFVEVSQLVQSALDGYKVCIFAYGQIGSGKTYTMMGKPDAPEHKGLIPRSMDQIFQTIQALVGQGWKYKLQASMLEIYNETIRDLLVPNKASVLAISRRDNEKKYAIKHDANGNTNVPDLTIVDVCNTKEISLLLEQAAQSRSVAKTNMNEQSSRSHFIFTMQIYGVNENAKQQVQGVLNLIDLAGNEQFSKSDAGGDRLKETRAINKSLSSLSSVILALENKRGHVPFRDSKLTRLLQPCLGGDSKTLMFVNISPDRSSVAESLCSLRFAERVNAVSRPQTTVSRRTRRSISRKA